MADNLYTENPSYKNKTFLLTNKDRNGLFVMPDTSTCLLVRINGAGIISTYHIGKNKIIESNKSIADLVKIHLKLNDLSIRNIIKYLAIPEMEIERIFNSLRYKYIKSIYLSKFSNPNHYLSAEFNKVFQALSGTIVYQGNPNVRRTNDSFWKDEGFLEEAKDQNWGKERDELKNIISLLKVINSSSITKTYAELIAVKPGFHELYLHDDYFDESCITSSHNPRDSIFRALRNKANIKSLSLDKLPNDINKNSYFSYAPCCITEGPFVFRKSIKVSYYEEIRKIKSKQQLHQLKDKFHILDYSCQNISTREKLERLLQKSEHFCNFLI